MRLQEAVRSVMRRLDDEDGVVWSYDEIALYIKDGYDTYCRETKCLFDIHVIENVPQAGNWSTDFERYYAENTPGMGLTDQQLNFTSDSERDMGITGAVGGSTEGPVRMTSPGEASFLDHFSVPSKVAVGRLPDNYVDIFRVTWDDLEMNAVGSAEMKRLDNQYERRDGGDPRSYILDKDGLYSIRFVPPALADAVYATVSGSWGTMTQTDDTTVTVSGSWGILREVEGAFPALGPWGTPTRQHPSTRNIMVEIARLGRSLDSHPFELPVSHIKFVLFWAMHRALKKDGQGQDLKLSVHYGQRFKMGVMRMQSRLKKVEKEFVLKMGSDGEQQSPFDIGEPQLPYPYGPRGRNIQ